MLNAPGKLNDCGKVNDCGIGGVPNDCGIQHDCGFCCFFLINLKDRGILNGRVVRNNCGKASHYMEK